MQIEPIQSDRGPRLVRDWCGHRAYSDGAERDIRAHVTRRKISFGARSESGLAAGDACLGALKTCNKLGVSYWDYLRDRLEVSGVPNVPRLADLIAQRAAT